MFVRQVDWRVVRDGGKDLDSDASTGTSTGTTGDTYGADISVDATNRLGSLTGTESNRADETCPGENC